MIKASFYRTIGYILTALGSVVFIINISQSYKFQRFLANPSAELLPAAFSMFGFLAFNVFLWAGLLGLWKADTIENPEKKPESLKIIKPYAILTVVMIVITILVVISSKILPAR